MIHHWGKDVEVYPRSCALIEKGGKFISNYICTTEVNKVQMSPEAILKENSSASFYSVIFAPKNSSFDLGSRVFLQEKGANAEIISRVVSEGGKVITRGDIIGEVPFTKGYMSCNGLFFCQICNFFQLTGFLK